MVGRWRPDNAGLWVSTLWTTGPNRMLGRCWLPLQLTPEPDSASYHQIPAQDSLLLPTPGLHKLTVLLALLCPLRGWAWALLSPLFIAPAAGPSIY